LAISNSGLLPPIGDPVLANHILLSLAHNLIGYLRRVTYNSLNVSDPF